MNRKKYRKRRKRGRGLLLGSDWPKIYRNLRLHLKKKNQKGGSLWTWAVKKIADKNNPIAKFLNRR